MARGSANLRHPFLPQLESAAAHFNRTAADTSLSSDAVARAAMAYVRSASDTTLTTDTAVRVVAFARSGADTSASSDSATRAAMARSRAASDTSASTDTAVRAAMAFARSAADSSSTSDAAVRGALAQPRTGSDTSLTTDTATRAARALTRSAADTSASSDAATRTFTLARTASDTSASSDAATRGALARQRSGSDTSATTDSAVRAALALVRTASDTTATSDAATRLLVLTRRAGTTYAALIASNTPGGWWRLDDTSGTTAVDQEAADNGTYTSPTLGVAGLITGDPDTAASFDGTNSQLTLPGPNPGTTAGSVELWFTWTAGLVLVRDDTGSGASWILGFDNAGTFAVRVGSVSTVNTSAATTAVRDGGRHHFVVAWGAGAFTVYLDGVSIGTGSVGATAPAMPWHVAQNGNITSQRSAMVADEIAIYTVALSASQVFADYSCGLDRVDLTLTTDSTVRGAVARTRSTADTSTTTDAATRATMAFARAASDTSASTDTARIGALARSGTDTSTTSDTAVRFVAFARSAADTSQSSDAATRGAMAFTRTSADTSITRDTATRTIVSIRTAADVSLASDAASAAPRMARTATDVTLTSDTATRLVSFVRTAADTSLTGDSATVLLVASTVQACATTTWAFDAQTASTLATQTTAMGGLTQPSATATITTGCD